MTILVSITQLGTFIIRLKVFLVEMRVLYRFPPDDANVNLLYECFFCFSRKHMFVIFKIPNGFSLPRIPWGIYRTISAAEIVFLASATQLKSENKSQNFFEAVCQHFIYSHQLSAVLFLLDLA